MSTAASHWVALVRQDHAVVSTSTNGATTNRELGKARHSYRLIRASGDQSAQPSPGSERVT
jgi:hypothetical protein